jgi:hypothetical protein
MAVLLNEPDARSGYDRSASAESGSPGFVERGEAVIAQDP